MRILTGVLALLLGGGVGLATRASDIQVSSLISDYDSGVAPALQIQSDQLGAYTSSRTLTSILTSFGAWALDSYYPRGATRTMALRFSQPVPGSGPGGSEPSAPPSGRYRAVLNSSCNHPNYASSFLTLPPGQTMACPLVVRFDSDGRTYVLHMNDRDLRVPETNHVNVTCIYPTQGTGTCSQWLIRPAGVQIASDGTTRLVNVARLSEEVFVKGQTTYVLQGDFFLSFSLIVTKP